MINMFLDGLFIWRSVIESSVMVVCELLLGAQSRLAHAGGVC